MAIPDEYWTEVIKCTPDAKIENAVLPHFVFHDQDGEVILTPISGRLVKLGVIEGVEYVIELWAFLRFHCYPSIVRNILDKTTGLETIEIYEVKGYNHPFTLQELRDVTELAKTTPVADRRHHLEDGEETPGTPSEYADLYRELSELQLPKKTGSPARACTFGR